MQKEGSISYILPTLLIVALAVTTFSLFRGDMLREKQFLTRFTDARLMLFEKGLDGIRQEVDAAYPDLLKDCKDRAAYDAYIDMDSRTMTAGQLREALSYHEECGQFFVHKTAITLAYFQHEIERLSDAANVLQEGKEKKEALEIVHFWQQIFDLESQNASIYKRLVDIQKEYWTADLNKAIYVDTSEEREAKVGALNYEANQKLDQISKVRDDINRFKEAEAAYWDEHFATSTPKKGE